MNIDFIAYQPDKYQIILFDYTPLFQDNIPQQIFSMKLSIIGENVVSTEKIDLLAYFYSSNRKDNNLYIITSEDLGLGENQEIPDGVYIITYTINNVYEKTYKFLVYKTVEERTLQMLVDTNYNMKIGNYDLEYVGDTCKGDVEQVRLAISLLDELRRLTIINDEVKVLTTLDKLQRLLTLIENEII